MITLGWFYGHWICNKPGIRNVLHHHKLLLPDLVAQGEGPPTLNNTLSSWCELQFFSMKNTNQTLWVLVCDPHQWWEEMCESRVKGEGVLSSCIYLATATDD